MSASGSSYRKVTVVLKDAPTHADFNRRILEYLKDRHRQINTAGFTVAIEAADSLNLNEFVRKGVESLPALISFSDSVPLVYGVNSIIAALARMEAAQPSDVAVSGGSQPAPPQAVDHQESFYQFVMKEMESGEQDDPNSPSTITAYNQESLEQPLTPELIEEKTKAFSKNYTDRRLPTGMKHSSFSGRSAGAAPPPSSRLSVRPLPPKMDVDAYIRQNNFDKGEEMLMRRIAENMG